MGGSGYCAGGDIVNGDGIAVLVGSIGTAGGEDDVKKIERKAHTPI